MPEVVAEPLSRLRSRTSVKWQSFPEDVIPLFVAETDYPLAPPVAEVLLDRIRSSDTGYIAGPAAVGEAFAGFAERRWGWSVDPGEVRTTTDLSVAIVETLRLAIEPGDSVVVTPPIYSPFYDLIPEAGGRVVEVPLRRDDLAYELDLEALEAAFAAGARAFLLCNPHNPLGLVHPRTTLEAVAELAERHGVTVVSDEIHGPLTHPEVEFTPFLAVSDAAREVGIALPSASKAFNLAGVKCALLVPGSRRGSELLAGLPEEVGFRTSILGAAASEAAYRDGDAWLDATIATIVESRELLTRLVAERLPGARVNAPRASYLAWLDLSALGWGDDPADRALEQARVALSSGLVFSREGRQGAGFARLNFACSPELLTEAVDRLAAAR